jgi:predicted amino acid dehydrogenase
MDNFAFIIHPIEPQKDVARKFPIFGKLPPGVIDYFSRFFPPVTLSHIAGIRSEATGNEIEGWLVACPMTPRRLMSVPPQVAYKKIIQTGELAQRLGAKILGLGAFTSIVGDAGITVSRGLSIPVTTGDSYTVAVAVKAALEAARRMGHEPGSLVAAIVGAYGATGQACAQLLARQVPNMILVGRQLSSLEGVREKAETGGASISVATRLRAIHQADLVLAVTSSLEPIIEAEHLRAGTVVCDVARPRNVSRAVVEKRDDVLVIEGGIVDLPGDVDFGFNFGFPPGKAYACMAEAALLALEGRYESYTLGRNITLERVDEIAQMASKHGVRLAGFRSFERALTDEYIDRIRERACIARAQN